MKNPYKKRYMVLLNGTLTWYRKEIGKEAGHLHIEDYVVQLDEDQPDNKYTYFRLLNEADPLTTHKLKGEGRHELLLRATPDVADEVMLKLRAAIGRTRQVGQHYTIEFGGMRFLQNTKKEKKEEEKADLILPNDGQSLTDDPVKLTIVEVAVSDELFARLTPDLQSGTLIRIRPVLVTQGISGNVVAATQRSLFSYSMLEFRNQVNFRASHMFHQLYRDHVDLPDEMQAGPHALQDILHLLCEFDACLEQARNNSQPQPGILCLASDLAAALGGIKLVNCMSGKDRTGMSVTLDQARVLGQRHGLLRTGLLSRPSDRVFYPKMKDRAREDEELATLAVKSAGQDVAKSNVLHVAKLMRIHGTRVHICRKCIGLPKFKGFINIFCYKPPKNVSADKIDA